MNELTWEAAERRDSPAPGSARAPFDARQASLLVLIGMACAVVGLLPPLVSGGRLVLQNLWATQTAPGEMPIVLLPFSQYELDLVAGTILIGSAVAGITARLLAVRGVRHARVAILLGVLVAQVVALVQTASTVAGGLQGAMSPLATDSLVYLTAVIAWILLSIAVGVAVFVLMTRPSQALFVIGVGVASVVLGPWIRGFVAPLQSLPPSPGSAGLLIAQAAPAVAVHIIIDRVGVGSWRRILAAVTALAALWLGSAAVTAVAGATGSRNLLRDPSGLASYFHGLFLDELRVEAPAFLVVAAFFFVLGIILRLTRAHRFLRLP